MCGRFDLHARPDTVARAVGAPVPAGGGLETTRGYNITPGRPILAVQADPTSSAPVLALSDWGFRPEWAGDDAPTPINARAETMAGSRYFREAFARQRCLIPANGWYEWQRTDGGKQPWYVTAPAEAVIFYAGIWTPSAIHPGQRCAIITEPARGVAASVHPRMPLVLAPECLAAWLDPSLSDRDAIRRTVRRLDPAALAAWPVSTRVNRPAEDDPALIEPLED